MSRILTSALVVRYGWRWKPSSLEVMSVNVGCGSGHVVVGAGPDLWSYTVVNSMISLGGVLHNTRPDNALVRYRLHMGDRAFHKFRKHLVGEAPVSLKLKAWAMRPRAAALFLCQIIH